MAAKYMASSSSLSATESGQKHNCRCGTMASLKPIDRTVFDGVPKAYG